MRLFELPPRIQIPAVPVLGRAVRPSAATPIKLPVTTVLVVKVVFSEMPLLLPLITFLSIRLLFTAVVPPSAMPKPTLAIAVVPAAFNPM